MLSSFPQRLRTYVVRERPREQSMTSISAIQVKAIKAAHGKKAFGQVTVDQVYGYVQHPFRVYH